MKEHRGMLIVFFLSCIICVAYAFWHRIHPVVDAKAYDQIALNLVAGHGFREQSTVDVLHDTAIVRAGPGYEFFLAGVYLLFGHRYEVVWVLQALLHGITAFLLYFISLRVFPEHGKRMALIAASLFAFWPDLIEISAMLMTETLYVFFTALAVFLFVRTEDKKTSFGSLLVGIATGIGVLTRPPLVLFAVVFVAWYLWKKAFRQTFVFLSAFGIMLLPWVCRNYLVFHEVILTTMIGEYNLWVGNMPGADGGQISEGFNPATAYAAQFGFLGFKAAAKQAFWWFVVHEPVQFVTLCLIRVVRFASLIRPMGFWFYQTGLPQMIFVFSSLLWIAGVFLAGAVGMVLSLRERRRVLWVLIALALTSPLVLIPTVVQSRYRFQIYPFVVLFAAYAWVMIRKEPKFLKTKFVWLPVGFLLFCTLIDVALNVSTIMDRLS